MINRQKIIERIQALFALGDTTRNPNEGEVKTALRMAKKLMAKYNLSLSEIELKKQGENGIGITSHDELKMYRGWELKLAHIACKLFNVQMVVNKQSFSKKSNLLFVGFKVDGQLAKECFTYLYTTIKLMSSSITPKESRYAYRAGLIDTLYERVEAELELDKSYLEKSKALVVIKNEMIKTWVNKNMNTHTTQSKYRNYSANDFFAYIKGQVDV